jgi:hypothetical protein
LSNFFKEFDAEWLAISGEFLEKGAEIRPARRVWSILPAIGGLFLAKATSLGGERYLDFEQNGPNQNHQDFPFRL